MSPVLVEAALNWNPLRAITSTLSVTNELSREAVVVTDIAGKVCVAKSSLPASVTSSATPSLVSIPESAVLVFPLLLTRA